MSEKFVFEAAMKQLEEIVRQLEKGDVPLELSLSLFEQGTSLIRACGSALDGAEQKMKLLIQTPEGPAEADFEPGGQA